MEVHCIDKILEEHNLSVYTEMIQTCMLVYINPTKQKSQKKKNKKNFVRKKDTGVLMGMFHTGRHLTLQASTN